MFSYFFLLLHYSMDFLLLFFPFMYFLVYRLIVCSPYLCWWKSFGPGPFPGGKNLFAKEWGEGEIIVHNAAMNQNPKPKLVLLLPCCCSITFFTSTSNINYTVFFMLEHFFWQFLKTRSYDRSAYTFRSSHRFLEVPHKGVLNKWFVGIFIHIPEVPLLLPGGGGRDQKSNFLEKIKKNYPPKNPKELNFNSCQIIDKRINDVHCDSWSGSYQDQVIIS